MRKVLCLINSLKNGGPVNMLYSLCKYLDNTQYKIYVMALKKCDINARDFSNLNCELIIINENNKLKRINKAFEEIKRISPDIIHSHGGLADWINVHTKNGSKKITTIHCDPDIDLIMKYGKVKGTIVANIFLHNLKRMDCPIACSETISNKIYENRKVKFDYIRNGIDPTMLVVNKSIKRSELKIEESDTVYAFCGYLSKRKNVKFLIEVFNTLPNNYKLLVIGDGDELVALKTSAKKDNVIFVGKVSTPANYLQLSDYFISASLSEGLPMAVMEGMALGLPPVLSRIDSHIEVKKCCEEGIELFDLDNVDDLSTIIKNKVKDDKINSLVKNCAYNYLHAKRMALEYQEKYKDLIRNGDQ